MTRGDGADASAVLGAVYTQRWVVELLLDQIGYTVTEDLTEGMLIEPCCGDGAFAVPVVQRLLQSAAAREVPAEQLTRAVVFLDIDPSAVEQTRSAVSSELRGAGLDNTTVELLLDSWVRTGDFLTTAPELPPARWVVGNPPYIRLEDVPEELRVRYRASWTTMRGRADIYVGFWEAALRLLVDGGQVGFVCADRWMRNQYGTRLRTLITSSYGLELVLDLRDTDAFERTVGAYPAITVVSRGAARSDVSVGKLVDHFEHSDLGAVGEALGHGGEHETVAFHVWTAPRAEFGSAGWTLLPPARREAARRVARLLGVLEDTGVKVRGGLATGADDVFILDGPSEVEAELLRPIVGPSDLVDGRLAWSGRRLLYPWTNDRAVISLTDYPRAAAYLHAHEDRLRRRHVARNLDIGWWRTIDKEPLSGYVGEALLVPDIRECVEPVLDRDEHVPMHSLYRLTSDTWDLEVLGGVLLSDMVHEQMQSMSVAMASGRMRVSAQYLRRLRLPTSAQVEAEADALRRAFRERDRTAASELVDVVVDSIDSAFEEATTASRS